MALLKKSTIKHHTTIICVLLLGILQPSSAATPDQVKAAFLYNFTRYVIWPAQAFTDETSPFFLCIDANNNFTNIVTLTVKDEHVSKHPFEVINLQQKQPLRGCHAIFIGKDEKSKLQSYGQLFKSNSLIVSDIENCAAMPDGCILELKQESNKFKININHQRALQAGLNIKASLLSLNIVTLVTEQNN